MLQSHTFKNSTSRIIICLRHKIQMRASVKDNGIIMKTDEIKYRKLRWFNAIMGFLHFLQGTLMLVLSNDFSLPVKTSFLKFDSATQTVSPATETIYQLRIGPMIALFLFISAVAHFSLAAPFGYTWYVKNLKKKINYARWYEYAISSSVMIVVIAMFSGVYDIASLILIFALNATMNLFGLMMELHNQTTERINWTAYVFGCFAGFVPWLVILIYFFGAISTSNVAIPTFVYFIILTIALLFFSFAGNMFLQYKKVWKWKDYLYGETGYIVLSLVAKSALAWQVFAGTLMGG